MSSALKKFVGVSALGAISLVEMLHLQQVSATPVTFTGSTVPNPRGGSVQVAITVDGSSGIYRITSISTPVQPGGQNASYASYAIPTLTSEAIAAQSAAITGISGASEISAAWKSSLSSAIAAAAAAGEIIGQTSVAPTPTPTPSAGTPTPSSGTPTPGATNPPATSSGTPAAPGPVASPGGIVVPYFAPLNIQSLIIGGTPNFASYIAQISTVLTQLSRVSGDGGSSALTTARNSLTSLQAQIQTETSQYQSSPGNLASYVAMVNSQFANLVSQANQSIAAYYLEVQNAADALYANAQASAAAIKAIPAPTVTVTVTATPAPPPVLIKPGGVILKSFTCLKTVAGKTSKQKLKGFVMKCPTGWVLVKK